MKGEIMVDKSVVTTRLASLLKKSRAGLQQSLDSLTSQQGDSKLPRINVDDAEIATATMYLRDLGLEYDALRLHGAFKQCTNRCVGEWLAAIAVGESEEYRDWLIKTFGSFPAGTSPNDPAVTDRKLMLAGCVAKLLEFVDELIGTVHAMLPLPRQPMPPVQTPQGEGNGGAGSTPQKRRSTKTPNSHRGRKKVSDDEEKRRKSILSDWDKAHNARTRRKKFCKEHDPPLTVKELDRIAGRLHHKLLSE